MFTKNVLFISDTQYSQQRQQQQQQNEQQNTYHLFLCLFFPFPCAIFQADLFELQSEKLISRVLGNSEKIV